MDIAETQTNRETRFSEQLDRESRLMGYAPDLDILTTFVRVAELLSFTKAARVLNKSQSTVSLHIKRMEEIYRCELFRRNKRSVELSGDGEILLSYARRIIHLHHSAQSQLHSRTVSGSLRVGIMEDFTRRHLPQILKQFSLNYPSVQIELHSAVSADLMSALDDCQLDVVLARKPRHENGGLTVWQEPLEWVVSRDYELSSDKPLPLVLFPHGCFYRPLVIEALDRRQIRWTIACTSTSLSGVCAAVGAGFGITVLAQSTIPADLARAPKRLSLPQLPPTEVALFQGRNANQELIDPLTDYVRNAFLA